MDPEITALAGTAGTTLVSLLATDAWQAAREGFVAIWRRVRPDRADTVSAELEATRDDLVRARDDGDLETEQELGAEWQGRIRRLLSAHPEVGAELRILMAELDPQTTVTTMVTQHATASGRSRVYQAGRDMHMDQQ
ncbi:hypothetical protein ACFU6I_39995 [Streptomyces sp. NPDC057486]|uniref:hypothetical protein n=1 Tax=Streptomyces sp. NPDC057486 TaxID=3346145 RepID=UPI00368213D7